MIVADLGSRSDALLPEVPMLLIDHHKPFGVPPGGTLLTGYRELNGDEDGKTIPTTGLLALWCARALVPERAEEWLWLAGTSLLSDLGDKALFLELAEAKKRFGSGAMRDVTSLLNAPRRSSSGDAKPALDLLLSAESPKEILKERRSKDRCATFSVGERKA